MSVNTKAVYMHSNFTLIEYLNLDWFNLISLCRYKGLCQ